MIVPAVGIVIENDHRSIRPFRALLQSIDDLHEEALLVERIGISSMAIFKSCSLEKAYGWQVVGFQSSKEIVDIVLMVRRILCMRVWYKGMADRCH